MHQSVAEVGRNIRKNIKEPEYEIKLLRSIILI